MSSVHQHIFTLPVNQTPTPMFVGVDVSWDVLVNVVLWGLFLDIYIIAVEWNI